MSVSNGIVSKTDSTSISEINSLIGAGSNDLGTICKHSNVNPYSKYKPVSKAQVGTMTDDNFRSINWGYIIPTVATTPQKLCQFVLNGTLPDNSWAKSGEGIVAMKNGWYYQKPTGGADSPYRLGDFRGYKHDVPKQIMGLIGTDTINLAHTAAENEEYRFSIDSEQDSYQFNIGDFNDTIRSTYRFGIIAYKPSSSSVVYVTSSAAINATNGNQIVLTFAQMKTLVGNAVGTGYFVPCLTTLSATTPTAQQHSAGGLTSTCLPLPNKPLAFTVINKSEGSNLPTPVNAIWRAINLDSGRTNNSYIRVDFDVQGQSRNGNITSLGNTKFYYKVQLWNMNETVTHTFTREIGTTPASLTITTSWTNVISVNVNERINNISGGDYGGKYKYNVSVYYMQSNVEMYIYSTGVEIYDPNA